MTHWWEIGTPDLNTPPLIRAFDHILCLDAQWAGESGQGNRSSCGARQHSSAPIPLPGSFQLETS